jgi:predicted DNA-binding protein (MmcQ/YjbR family)
MAHADLVLRRLRTICLKLPDAAEKTSFGHPTFVAGKKTFAVLEEYKGSLCIVFKSELAHRDLFLKDPRFFVAPYVGKYGWLSLKVDAGVNWTEVRHLVRESHRLVSADRAARRSKGVPK